MEFGSLITIDREFALLGTDLVTGKALDNRAGCVMMVTALKLLKSKKVQATIQAVGTVQEEVGLKGARTSAYGLTPDVAIATDVTIPGDHPGVTKSESTVASARARASPSSTRPAGASSHPVLCFAGCGSRRRRPRIPYQLQVGNGGNTDATVISISKTRHPLQRGHACRPATSTRRWKSCR